LLIALSLFGAGAALSSRLYAQIPPPFAAPTTPAAQRSSLKAVQTQVKWLQDATRTAPNYVTGGADKLWQQMQVVRGAYSAFKATLAPAQVAHGANDLAELDAGLDIIEEAFVGYQEEIAGGRSPSVALRGLCQVLTQSMGLWLRELNQSSNRLRVGWP